MAPDGTYVRDEPQMAPDGSYVRTEHHPDAQADDE
jgi:hypothetical protein